MTEEELKARETRLISENMGLVKSLAKKFRPPTQTELDEYIQVGTIGLLKAIRKFNPEKAKLSTWAYAHICWEIIRYIDSNNRRTVSLSQIAEISYLPKDSVILEHLPDYLLEKERKVIILKNDNYSLKDIMD